MLLCLSSSVGVVQRRGEIGPAPRRAKRHQVADHPQRVAAALRGRDHPLDLVGEQQRPGPVIGVRGGQGQDRCDLDGQRGLGTGHAEMGGARLVHHQQQGELPLFNECLDEGMPEAG